VMRARLGTRRPHPGCDSIATMRDSLEPGISNEASYIVTAAMSASHLPRVVLSTPSMIGLIEGTCLQAVQAHLDDGETTVGTHVCVSHQAAANEGEQFTIRCRLAKVVKRRLTFDVSVEGPAGRLSEGTHERAVISLDRMR
jgi:fluoroacetyl-CoA thioesterase